jgi:hypothetical protein
VRDPSETKERRLQAAAIVMPYMHPRYSTIEARVTVSSKEQLTLEALRDRVDREIDEAFREYQPPKTIEHVPGPMGEPAPVPDPPTERIGSGPERAFALEREPAENVEPLRPRRDYRRPRPLGSWSG